MIRLKHARGQGFRVDLSQRDGYPARRAPHDAHLVSAAAPSDQPLREQNEEVVAHRASAFPVKPFAQGPVATVSGPEDDAGVGLFAGRR